MGLTGRLTVTLVAMAAFLIVATTVAAADTSQPTSPVLTGNLLETGSGDDYIDATSDPAVPAKLRTDVIRCGLGFDTVEADPIDKVSADCEEVTRAGSAEQPSRQAMVTFNCDLNVMNPHYSAPYNQAAAKSRLSCATDINQLYLVTELYRSRAWGDQYLNSDSSWTTTRRKVANTNVRYGCGDRDDDYWFKNYTHGFAQHSGVRREYIGSKWSSGKFYCG